MECKAIFVLSCRFGLKNKEIIQFLQLLTPFDFLPVFIRNSKDSLSVPGHKIYIFSLNSCNKWDTNNSPFHRSTPPSHGKMALTFVKNENMTISVKLCIAEKLHDVRNSNSIDR